MRRRDRAGPEDRRLDRAHRTDRRAWRTTNSLGNGLRDRRQNACGGRRDLWLSHQIYGYHTSAQGLYAGGDAQPGATEAGRRHGRCRGWARSDENGRYTFETILPGAYPDGSMPAHIHLTVLEPGRPPYWIDDVVFEDDPALNDAYLAGSQDRGGSGVVSLVRGDDGENSATRDILLEVHP